ncbi:hypothetical protein K503DRAFT_18052 [Rhizopogon vinicolor AM-OR11-026]|uniref:Uncharacterized protein n=1 Tax=Rhizopogon vinicolor AM-OR11-026 TaxID=1314800 RepID=A0A1B7NGF6_9AGAM|nr:hypothetical protein K503DRAFT_18052 [Rhizopogon vinicolor AM-OR11-026]
MRDGSSRGDAFRHGSISGHHLPDDPVVTHIGRSDDSGSDHTIEAPRTPIPSHSSARMAPPHQSLAGGYVGKSPTNIYADGGHHEMRPMRHEAIYPSSRPPHSGGQGPIYYIIPGGMSVIFQDEYGNEVARVGDFNGRPAQRPAPYVVQDNHGRDVYRYDGDHERPHRHGEPRVVPVDPNHHSSRPPRSYSSQGYYSTPSHRHNDGYYHQHRSRGDRDRDHYRDEYRDRGYRDRGYRDREYQGREYKDREYRDREYRARDHRDRHHQDRDYRRRDDWRPEDHPRGSHPAMQRPNSSHTTSSRHENQFSQ